MERHNKRDRTDPASRYRDIPQSLKNKPRWVYWNNNKVPYTPTTVKPASVTNPETWGTFEQALEHPHIGYALGDGVGCIDLDYCISPQQELTETAKKIVKFYPNNWVEVSPSGLGLHIWGTAKPQKGFKRVWHEQPIEFYSTGRYITITGNTWQQGTLKPL